MDSHYQQEAFKAAAKERGFIYPEAKNYDELKKYSKYLRVKDLKNFAAIRGGVNIHEKMSKHNLIDAIWNVMKESPRLLDYMHFFVFANKAMIRFLAKEGVMFVMGEKKWIEIVARRKSVIYPTNHTTIITNIEMI